MGRGLSIVSEGLLPEQESAYMLPFVFVTESNDKLVEAERILGYSLRHAALSLPEIQSVELEPVVEFKVKAAFERLQEPVMVEDTGLFIEAWNRYPGALVKWLVRSVCEEGLCRMMAPFTNRTAWATTMVATFDGRTEIHYFVGTVEGRIVRKIRGDNSFGWARVFVPLKSRMTFAQMPPLQKDQFSMRSIALNSLKSFYADHLSDAIGG